MPNIIVVLGGKKLGSYPMKASPWIVGRHASCNVRIDNVGVSRRHCQFTCENGAYFVEDLGSSNGTFVAGKRVKKAPVENGTEISIGKYALVFEDLGLDLMPAGTAPAARPAAGAPAPAGAMRTFQMDPATIREQIAKAGAAAASAAAEVVKKAADVAKAFDPDAPLEIKGKEERRSLVSMLIRLGAVAVAAAIAIIVVYFVVFA